MHRDDGPAQENKGVHTEGKHDVGIQSPKTLRR